jgi:hypothetical protein
MSSVVAPSAFKVSNVTFSPVKMLESGGKQAYLNYNGGPLVMQVGPLETPFGLSVFDKQGPPKYSVDLKLRGYDDPTNHPKTATIYNAFHALDEYMLDQGVKNSAAWFKGVKSREVLSELYTPVVRFSLDAEGNRKPYPPTLKVQLRKRDDKFEADIYDENKRPLNDVPLEDIIVKGTVLTTLIQCTGVWFAGGKYGLSWKAIQIRADKVPHTFRGKPAFLDEDGTAEDAPAPAPKAAAATAAAAAPANRFAALHDDDEEVDDEEALAPAAAAAPAVAPAEDEDDEEAPIPVPAKKTTMSAKSLPKKIVKKAA